jgi:queuine tRNA-ribosyltransferase
VHTHHGSIETPAFMPVGTAGSVKAMTPEEVAGLGFEMILANTYHLALRPGEAIVRRLGGLHRFMGWERSILTDSGGFQVLSLQERSERSDDGVAFRSHLDGTALMMTPERSMAIQEALGADIVMAFDDCPPLPSPPERLREAVRRTTAWAERSRAAFPDDGRALFGIVQGGDDKALRSESAEALRRVGFDGFAVGGVSVGESAALSRDVVAMTAPMLPDDRARYLMGMGMPADLLDMMALGIDLFDCVLPTRNARNGQLFTRRGTLSIKNARYAEDREPPDPDCSCPTCRRHSRAYLRYHFVAGEMAAATLNTLHNLHFYLDTMSRIRNAIEFGTFAEFRREFLRTFSRRPPSLSLDA